MAVRSANMSLVSAEAQAAAHGEWRDGLPVLESRRVILREVTSRDAVALAASLGRPEVMEHLSPGPTSPKQFARFISWVRRERRGGRYLCFAIVPKSAGRAAGVVQLWPIEPSFHIAELGFALDPVFWGTGVFGESASLILDLSFASLGVRRIECRTAVANRRAIGALRKLGAVHEGTLRACATRPGGPVDHEMWSILAKDWIAGGAAPPVRVA